MISGRFDEAYELLVFFPIVGRGRVYLTIKVILFSNYLYMISDLIQCCFYWIEPVVGSCFSKLLKSMVLI